jgi:hypothetical protein
MTPAKASWPTAKSPEPNNAADHHTTGRKKSSRQNKRSCFPAQTKNPPISLPTPAPITSPLYAPDQIDIVRALIPAMRPSSDLSPAGHLGTEIAALAASGEKRSYRAGDVIFAAGAPGDPDRGHQQGTGRR